MTDEQNKRQRHLAEMMIAQCDGRTVQDFGRNTDHTGRWLDIETPIIAGHCYQHAKLRIKPEPREWWLCPRCAQSLDKSCSQRVTDSLLKSHRDGAGVVCESSFIKVREVLND